jgi:rubrerythrin
MTITVVNLEFQEWLEDSRNGKFSRYATEPEESVWECNRCGHEGCDPYDEGCPNCGEEADYFN